MATTNNQTTKVIRTLKAFIAELKAAKCGGQYVTLYAETPVSMAAFPTDGSEKVHIDKNFVARKQFAVEYHFGASFDKMMSKLLGTDYHASDYNRRHIVPNVLMQYISTGTICCIYMPEDYVGTSAYVGADGHPLTDEELAYMRRYKKVSKDGAIPYRTLALKNVTRMVINHISYEIAIPNEELVAKAA